MRICGKQWPAESEHEWRPPCQFEADHPYPCSWDDTWNADPFRQARAVAAARRYTLPAREMLDIEQPGR